MFSHIVCVSECLHAAPTTTTASAAATAAQEGKHTSPVHPPTPRRLAHLDFIHWQIARRQTRPLLLLPLLREVSSQQSRLIHRDISIRLLVIFHCT